MRSNCLAASVWKSEKAVGTIVAWFGFNTRRGAHLSVACRRLNTLPLCAVLDYADLDLPSVSSVRPLLVGIQTCYSSWGNRFNQKKKRRGRRKPHLSSVLFRQILDEANYQLIHYIASLTVYMIKLWNPEEISNANSFNTVIFFSFILFIYLN